jgi:hypothetical protein
VTARACPNSFSHRNDGGRCTCAECGRDFGGLRGFDLHRIAPTGQPGSDRDYDWACGGSDDDLKARGLPLTRRSVWLEGPSWLHARGQEPSRAVPHPGAWSQGAAGGTA